VLQFLPKDRSHTLAFGGLSATRLKRLALMLSTPAIGKDFFIVSQKRILGSVAAIQKHGMKTGCVVCE